MAVPEPPVAVESSVYCPASTGAFSVFGRADEVFPATTTPPLSFSTSVVDAWWVRGARVVAV
ncbi:MAG: hypothetical protein ACRD0F_10475 [Acidimicrobiales bacterium]